MKIESNNVKAEPPIMMLSMKYLDKKQLEQVKNQNEEVKENIDKMISNIFLTAKENLEELISARSEKKDKLESDTKVIKNDIQV